MIRTIRTIRTIQTIQTIQTIPHSRRLHDYSYSGLGRLVVAVIVPHSTMGWLLSCPGVELVDCPRRLWLGRGEADLAQGSKSKPFHFQPSHPQSLQMDFTILHQVFVKWSSYS